MRYLRSLLKLISSPQGLHVLRRQASVVVLVYSLGLVSTVLAIDVYLPRLAPSLVPILLVALSLALVLAMLSLWSVRSEQRGTDQAFRNTDCEFSSIFQNVLDGILILDNEANCLDANPAGASILRIARDDLIGKNVSVFFRDSEIFTRRWQQFLQSKSRRGRVQLLAGDGTNAVVDFSGAANYFPGRHIFILCDVTEQNRAANALRESEERFRYVADNIQELIWRMNADTKEVVYVNQAYTTITGHNIDSLYQDPSSYQELIHPQDRIRVLSRLREAVFSGQFDEEFQFIHANGTIRWIWVKASLAPDNGNTRWLVGAAMDITSRKQAEQQISEHLDAAEAARAEAEALRKATLALSHNLSMDSVLDTLLECIGELVPFDKASILFMDDPDHMFVAREAPRTQPRGTICVLSCSDNHFLQKILFEHKPALLSDAAKDPDWGDVAPFDRTRSWLGIPLIAAGRVIGVLSLSSHTPSVFSTEHLRLAKNLAVSAAVAIENARTHERAEIYAAELELRLEELREAQKALQQVAREPSDHTAP
jgi:PAS domain S-box-containing protein